MSSPGACDVAASGKGFTWFLMAEEEGSIPEKWKRMLTTLISSEASIKTLKLAEMGQPRGPTTRAGLRRNHGRGLRAFSGPGEPGQVCLAFCTWLRF